MTDAERKTIISIFGNSRCGPESSEYQHAARLGRLLAEARITVCTGGYDGIMEAASRAAHLAGGEVIGVTVDIFSSPPNPFLTKEIRVPNLFSRLQRLAELSDGFIGLRGSIGTITEVALIWNLLVLDWFSAPKPFILVGPEWRAVVQSWQSHLAVDGRDLPYVVLAETADDACHHLLNQGVCETHRLI